MIFQILFLAGATQRIINSRSIFLIFQCQTRQKTIKMFCHVSKNEHADIIQRLVTSLIYEDTAQHVDWPCTPRQCTRRDWLNDALMQNCVVSSATSLSEDISQWVFFFEHPITETFGACDDHMENRSLPIYFAWTKMQNCRMGLYTLPWMQCTESLAGSHLGMQVRWKARGMFIVIITRLIITCIDFTVFYLTQPRNV